MAEREGVPQVWCISALRCQPILKVATERKLRFGAVSNRADHTSRAFPPTGPPERKPRPGDTGRGKFVTMQPSRTRFHPMSKPTLQAVDPNAPTTAAPDPFDIASLRLNPSFIETAGVKKLLTTVPVRKPSPQDFIRVHPAPEYRENFALIDLKDDREDFLVRPEILPDLATEVVYKTIFTAINRQGVVFLWPVRLPTPDDRKSDWHRSAREGAEMAMSRWIRLKPNMSLGANEISLAGSVMAEPVWPELSYEELLRIGYRDRMITTLEHPVILRLRGLA